VIALDDRNVQPGLIFNVQRFSLHDGPGLRSTVFVKGCPLRCAWCHNPESQSAHQEFVRIAARCMRCDRCTDEELASPVVTGKDETDVDLCPTGALQAVGRLVTPADLVTELLRDRVFFDESGGGVTFSGGEPLTQAEFVSDCLRRLRDEGVHTALDTCGFAHWHDLHDAAQHANLVLFDLKLMDAPRHRAATGVPNERILDNLRRLAAVHANIWIRVPVIPGVNDDAGNLAETAEFVSRLAGIRRVDLLPYHATGEPKFARVGLDYSLRETTAPSEQHLEHVAAFFRDRGLTTTVGGHP
jgi:pyruvate formate lyase activating enzyme